MSPDLPPSSAAGVDSRDTRRTIGPVRLHRSDRGDAGEDETAAQAATKYEIEISSMSTGVDGGQDVIEGTVEITEYVNGCYVSAVIVTSSVVVEGDTPLSQVEHRLIESTRETITRLAGLSDAEMRQCFEGTRKDQDEPDLEDDEDVMGETDTGSEEQDANGPPQGDAESEPYDATRDPRTGRPPNLLEAQRLAREHQRERLESRDEEGAMTDEETTAGADMAQDGGSDAPAGPEGQAPARMTSPKVDEDEKAAIDSLVQDGVAREQAEELVRTHGTNPETLKAAAFAGDT